MALSQNTFILVKAHDWNIETLAPNLPFEP